MEKIPAKKILAFFLVSIVTAFLLAACNATETPIEPPKTQTISGRVLDMLSQALPPPLQPRPIAGATLQLVSSDPNSECRCDCMDDGSDIRTISDENGNWVLPNVPLTYDPKTYQANSLFIKVTAPGYSTAHNQYMPVLGDKYDMMISSTGFYGLLYILYGVETGSFADPNKLCILMGAALSFTDMEYPQKTEPIEGVTVHASGGTPPQDFKISYLGGEGKTSSTGAFLFVVPDAKDGAPVVTVSGGSEEEPKLTLVGGEFPACPGSFVPAGLINPF
jgi:hypothetical protein